MLNGSALAKALSKLSVTITERKSVGHEPQDQSAHKDKGVNKLTIFGLFAVTAMLFTYALEKRSHWFILAFAGSCVLGSAYGFLQGAWPFGIVEAIWAIVATVRWRTVSSI